MERYKQGRGEARREAYIWLLFGSPTPPDGYMLPENSADRIKAVYVDTDKMVDGGYTHTITFTNHRVKTLVVEKRDVSTPDIV